MGADSVWGKSLQPFLRAGKLSKMESQPTSQTASIWERLVQGASRRFAVAATPLTPPFHVYARYATGGTCVINRARFQKNRGVTRCMIAAA